MSKRPRKYSITDLPRECAIELVGYGSALTVAYEPHNAKSFRKACEKIHAHATDLIESYPEDRVIFRVTNKRTNQWWIWTG